jgi:hypothetical protein
MLKTDMAKQILNSNLFGTIGTLILQLTNTGLGGLGGSPTLDGKVIILFGHMDSVV